MINIVQNWEDMAGFCGWVVGVWEGWRYVSIFARGVPDSDSQILTIYFVRLIFCSYHPVWNCWGWPDWRPQGIDDAKQNENLSLKAWKHKENFKYYLVNTSLRTIRYQFIKYQEIKFSAILLTILDCSLILRVHCSVYHHQGTLVGFEAKYKD